MERKRNETSSQARRCLSFSEERLSPREDVKLCLRHSEDIMRDTRGLSFFVPKIKSGLPLDKNGFMLIQEQRSRVVRFKNQEDKP